jgi:hypothetical protein
MSLKNSQDLFYSHIKTKKALDTKAFPGNNLVRLITSVLLLSLQLNHLQLSQQEQE